MRIKRIIAALLCTAVLTATGCGSSSSSDTKSSEDGESMVNTAGADTPFGKHGKLSVEGAYLTDSNGEKYQLYGMSTHGIAWFPQYVNSDGFTTLRDDWNTNCVRLAMYTYEYGGYCNDGDQKKLKETVENGVQYATDLGMYVIIDWHVLNEKSPNVYKDEAVKFFDEMSKKYKDYDNIIYEICNEPNSGSDWADIKSYADEVIPVIRDNDSDALIICGTPNWSQDCDKAQADPLDYDNILYAVHFYADTHTDWLRNKVAASMDSGFPIFISEFNITNAAGTGNVNIEQGNLWKELIDKYNLSYMCWSMANSKDPCSVFVEKNPKLSGWTTEDLSETGKWVYNCFTTEDNQ